MRRQRLTREQRLRRIVARITALEAGQARRPLGFAVPPELAALRQQARRWGGSAWRG